MSDQVGSTAPSARPGWPSEHLRVDLVDDDSSVRRALTRVLRRAGYDATAFHDAAAYLAAVAAGEAPSCLVVDLRLPGVSGLRLQQLLKEQGLETSVVFISGRADVRSGVEALKGGAFDFLEKPFTNDALLCAVARAVEQDCRRRARLAERTELASRLETLTFRERQVFGLVVTGRLNKQVGAELGTTEKTIKVHRARVMEKMRAGSLAELVRMADRLGPLDDAIGTAHEARPAQPRASPPTPRPPQMRLP